MLGGDWSPASPTPAPGAVRPEGQLSKLLELGPRARVKLTACLRAQTKTLERGDYLPGCKRWLFWGELG